jgi:hypothetical protein
VPAAEAEQTATTTPPPAEPATLPAHARAQPPRSIRPEPGAGAARLLGEDAIVPLEQRGTLEVWGPRLVAIVLVTLLLIALALIVRGALYAAWGSSPGAAPARTAAAARGSVPASIAARSPAISRCR